MARGLPQSPLAGALPEGLKREGLEGGAREGGAPLADRWPQAKPSPLAAEGQSRRPKPRAKARRPRPPPRLGRRGAKGSRAWLPSYTHPHPIKKNHNISGTNQ